ncbi:hypothetical protein PCE1_004176 [Barthelona sp. PCE]
MIDIEILRNDPERVKESEKNRFTVGGVENVDEVLRLDNEYRELNRELEQAKGNRNTLSKQFGRMRKAGEDITELAATLKDLKVRIPELEERVVEVLKERDHKFNQIGNLLDETVPIAEDEEEIHTISENLTEDITEGVKEGLTHVDLLYRIGGVDYDRGVKVMGNRGYYLKGIASRLNQAIISYSLDFLREREFTQIEVPMLMKREAMQKCAQLDDFHEQLYKVVEKDDDPEDKLKYLIATSEQPLIAMHMDEMMIPTDLPKLYAGYSSCFRKEAGSQGRDQAGIFRIHIFQKVEQIVYCLPEESPEYFNKLITNAEDFFKSLGLPYRVVAIPSGALNNAAAIKYDLEAFFMGSGQYRELVSCSNCTDYQSRNLMIRMPRDTETRKVPYVHLLNSTLCATSRALCCILERYQTEEGVVVPEVLRPYMGGMEMMPFVIDHNYESVGERLNKKKRSKK